MTNQCCEEDVKVAYSSKPAILGGRPIFHSKLPITRPELPEYDRLEEDIRKILRSGMVTKGRYLSAFEEAMAEHLGVKHAIAVSSCTTGLMLTFRGLELTGEVIVPSFTFMATVSSLVWAQLRPVFADVGIRSANLDPDVVEKAITPQTSAIVVVHNFGNPAAIDELKEIADRRNLKLVFDSAHGLGALYRGVQLGPEGDANVFSLTPTKLVVAGEGGIVATNDDDLAEKIRIGREYGNDGNYNTVFPGLNGRMAEFNALLGLHSLEMLESAVRHRNRVAGIFRENLGQLSCLEFQEIDHENRSAYKDFPVVVDPDLFGLTRDEFAEALAAENVDTRKYYDPPVHRQTAYRKYFSGENTLPNTDLLARNIICLPIWSHMDNAIALKICRVVQRIYEHSQEVASVLKQKSAKGI